MSNQCQGLFRSEKHLVIQRKGASFGPNCIWCNAAVTKDATDLPVAYLPPYGPGRGIINVLHRMSKRRTCNILVPICDSCKKKPLARGNRAGLIGLAAWALSGCLVAAAVIPDFPPRDPRALALIIAALTAFAVGLIILFVGIIAQGMGKRPPAGFIDEEYVWLSGVNPKILDEQPEWKGASLRDLHMSTY
jgi:hypothetical protein